MIGMIALGVAWRVVRYGACPPVWGDEAFIAVNLLTRDFAGLLRPLEYYQIAPLGFLWAELAVIRVLGTSEWAIRLIPFLSGLASLGLFAWFARKTVDRRSALMAVGIFAASYYLARHATEAKPYSTDLLFSMMTTGLAWSIWLDRDSIRRWMALTVLIAVGVWFSYPLVFVAAGVGTVLAVRVGTRPNRRVVSLFVAFGLTISTSWILSYLTFGRLQAEAAPFYTDLETWRDAFPPLSEPWLLPFWLLDTHTGNMLAYPNGGKNFASLGTAIAVAVGCLTLRKTRPAFLAMLLSPLVPTLVASAFHRYPYGTSARTTLYMAPAFCLIAGVGLVSLIRRYLWGVHRRRAYVVASLTFTVMILVSIGVNVALPYKNFEDAENRRVVRELVEMAEPGDRWLVYDGLHRMPRRDVLMLQHWIQQSAEVRYNIFAKAPVPVRWGVRATEDVGNRVDRTWLIVHRSGYPYFEEDRLSGLTEAFARTLGTPEIRTFPMTRGETIQTYRYPRPRDREPRGSVLPDGH
jgi:4-amino-4-deoxy-L-arabinose transferase-like glycosyltransferase